MKHELRIMKKLELSKFKLVLILVLNSLFLILNSSQTSAQELSVGIDPAILQIEASGPSLIKSPISIENQSDQNVTYNIFLVPFKANASGDGQPEFDGKLSQEYKNIFSRVKISDDKNTLTQISLAPKQKKDLTISIRLLKDETPRDYYFSVMFISETINQNDKESFIGARAGIGTNVLLSIGPKSPTRGGIGEFSGKRFLAKGPTIFKLNIRNDSSHYVTTDGNLLIKNIFGQTVGNLNFVPANILSNSNRLIESENNPNPNDPRIIWDEKFLLGIYKADLTITLSEEGPIFHDSFTFFAFPFEALAGLSIALIIVIGMIRRAREKEMG